MESYRVVANKKYLFYFPPRDCNDRLGAVQYRYSGGMDVIIKYYDHDTIVAVVDGPIGGEVDVHFANDRSIKLVISSQDEASISSSSSSTPTCPSGYFYDPNSGYCVPVPSSESSSSSTSSVNEAKEYCEQLGGVWIDGVCLSFSHNIQSSTSSISSSSSVTSSSSLSSSSSSSIVVEPGSCPSDTIFVNGHCVDKVAYELAGKVLPINGYFTHYGDGIFDWAYLNHNGHIFAKLEGMDPQTGLLHWKRLRSFFDRVEYRNGYIVVGAARSTSDEVVNTLANKRLRVNGYFTYFGDPEDYNPFMWAYVSSSGHLVAKLEGMDPSTGHLKWHFLIGAGVHKLQWVRIQNDRLIFGPLAQ